MDLEQRAEIKNHYFINAIAINLEGVEAFSVGSNPECEECEEDYDEKHFSWQHCDSCGSRLGGDRFPAHGIVQVELDGKVKEELIHLDICDDCRLYHANGDLPW